MVRCTYCLQLRLQGCHCLMHSSTCTACEHIELWLGRCPSSAPWMHCEKAAPANLPNLSAVCWHQSELALRTLHHTLPDMTCKVLFILDTAHLYCCMCSMCFLITLGSGCDMVLRLALACSFCLMKCVSLLVLPTHFIRQHEFWSQQQWQTDTRSAHATASLEPGCKGTTD